MTTQPSATHGVTPRTDAETFQLYREDVTGCAEAIDYVAASFARTLETELAAARAECEKLTEQRDKCVSCWTDACTERDMMCTELARLRAEVERLKMCGIVELAAINPSVADYCKHWEARAERAELALANARCPNVVSTDEGTHHCALAESTVAKLSAQLAEARKDSERFNLLASMLEDVNIGDMDPTKHRTDDNDWPDAWRTAIDAAMTNSNHKTT